MLPDVLRALAGKQFVDEDGEPVVLELEPPATPEQIEALEAAFPCPIPEDIREGLRLATGLVGGPLESVSLLGLDGGFGVEEVFPHAHPIAHDGFGNYWIVDLLPESKEWGPVYFACHDPPVVVYQSPNVAEFIAAVGRYWEPGCTSPIDQVHEEHSRRIWVENPDLLTRREALSSGDRELRSFAGTLPENALIADLRDARTGQGFSLGRFGRRQTSVRCGTSRIWALVPPERRLGLLARLFG